MKSLLKPAIELTEEGVEAAKETASNISTAAKDLFTTLVPKNSKISEEAVALHKMVQDRVDEGMSRRAAFKDISQLTGLTNTELDANEKIFSRLSGGGASNNIIDEVRLVVRALTTEPTSLQAAAKEVAGGKGTKSTRIAREKAGQAFISGSLLTGGALTAWNKLNEKEPTSKQATEFEKAFSKAHNAGKETFTFKGKKYTTEVKKGKAEGGSTNDASKSDEALAEQVKYYKQLINAAKTPEEQQQVNKMFGDMLPVILREIQGGAGEELVPKSKYMGGRMDKNEGSLMMPPEMESDMPVDTYPNIPPEEMDEAMESQLPDAEMEDKYLDFVLDESLDDEEQSYLMNALEADPKLSQIFDKVVTTASEFTGAGEVEGPGTGVSDSIPARLSDGEFVFTKKATDQMGADNLQVMMDDAERAYDGGMMREPANLGGLLSRDQDEDPMNYDKEMEDEEIQKGMLRANRAPSLMAG